MMIRVVLCVAMAKLTTGRRLSDCLTIAEERFLTGIIKREVDDPIVVIIDDVVVVVVAVVVDDDAVNVVVACSPRIRDYFLPIFCA